MAGPATVAELYPVFRGDDIYNDGVSNMAAYDEERSGRSDDFSAVRANARLELHEAVCAERYAGIDHKLNELVRKIDDQGIVFHGRLNTISSRVWAAATGALGLTVLGLAVMVFYLLTRAK